MPTIPAPIRRRLYPVCLAVIALAGGYGLIAEAQIPLWIALAAAVVGSGTATAHRPEVDG